MTLFIFNQLVQQVPVDLQKRTQKSVDARAMHGSSPTVSIHLLRQAPM